MKRKYVLYITKNEKYPGVRNLNDLKKMKTKIIFKNVFWNTCLVMMKAINIFKWQYTSYKTCCKAKMQAQVG